MTATQRQNDLLKFIRRRIERDNVAPSRREMQQFLGLASLSGVQSLVRRLEERGFIRCIPRRARAIRLSDPTSDRDVLIAALQAARLCVAPSQFPAAVKQIRDALKLVGEL